MRMFGLCRCVREVGDGLDPTGAAAPIRHMVGHHRGDRGKIDHLADDLAHDGASARSAPQQRHATGWWPMRRSGARRDRLAPAPGCLPCARFTARDSARPFRPLLARPHRVSRRRLGRHQRVLRQLGLQGRYPVPQRLDDHQRLRQLFTQRRAGHATGLPRLALRGGSSRSTTEREAR